MWAALLLRGIHGYRAYSPVKRFPGILVYRAQMGTAKIPWALGLWKVLWREYWWARGAGASGILGLRWGGHLERGFGVTKAR